MVVAQLADPTGIAIVGASDRRHYARSLINNLMRAGYDRGRIYPVNPRYDRVLELPCYPSLAEIGKPFSLAVVATGTSTVPGVVEEAAAAGAETVLILADGYAEQGEEGKERQRELERLAAKVGIHVLGPNTLGYLSPPHGAAVWAPGELPEPVQPGAIGVVFQSSGMLNLWLNLCITRGIGLRAAFSVGNEAGLHSADFINHLVDDPGTRVIVTLVETSTRPRELAAALQRAQEAGKPVVMLKLGSSERARRNALAHTGRMASPGDSWDALLERLGVVCVEDLDELVEMAVLLDHLARDGRFHQGSGETGVAVVTVSGGDCSLICDLCEKVGVTLAGLEPATHARLVELLEKPGLLGNPLDVENLPQEDASAFYDAIDTLCGDANVDVVAYRMYLPQRPTESNERLYRELAERTRAGGKVPVALSRAIEDLDVVWYEFFDGLEVPYLPAYRPGLSSIGRVCEWTRRPRASGALALGAIPAAVTEPPDGRVADWEATQEILRQAGVPYATARLVDDAAEGAAHADEVGGPVAVKLVATDAPHKSDIGGVRLGVSGGAAVVEAIEAIDRAARTAGVVPEGFEVQRMAPPGVEVILGVTTDPIVGPLVMVGMGGVLTEIVRDRVLAVPVLDPPDAEALLRRLAGYPLLSGYRGARPADVAALADVVSSLSRHVAASGDGLVALDLNPVMVLPEGEGVVAVDALAVVK